MQSILASAVVWLTLFNSIFPDRPNELVIVPFDQLKGIKPTTAVAYTEDGQQLPSQTVDTDFDGKVDSLAFIADFGKKEAKKVKIINGQPQKLAQKAHSEISVLATLPDAKGPGTEVADGQFVSKKRISRNKKHKIHDGWYRYEGPLIETDKVAYRLYWDKRGAIDVFGKISEQSLGEFHRGRHHTMQSWGRDLLHNGPALGIGGLGIGSDIKRFSPGGASKAKIIVGNDGPIYASYRMEYKGIKYQGKKYNLNWDISMYAGSRYMKHKITVTKGGDLQMLAAMTNHTDTYENMSEKQFLNQSVYLDFVATWGSQVFPDKNTELAAKSKEQMGLGLLWPGEQFVKLIKNETEYEAIFRPATEIEYYSLIAYNGEKDSPITSNKEFYKYMEGLSWALKNPIAVKIGEVKLLEF